MSKNQIFGARPKFLNALYNGFNHGLNYIVNVISDTYEFYKSVFDFFTTFDKNYDIHGDSRYRNGELINPSFFGCNEHSNFTADTPEIELENWHCIIMAENNLFFNWFDAFEIHINETVGGDIWVKIGESDNMENVRWGFGSYLHKIWKNNYSRYLRIREN